MGSRDLAFWLASAAIAGLLATPCGAQQAPKRGTGPCFGLSCPTQPVAEPPAKSETGAAVKPYDWKASFAQYKVGKVPRTPDGKPDLQGIWSRAILTPRGATVRRLLESLPPGPGAVQIAREGDSYRLVLPPGAVVDVALFGAAWLWAADQVIGREK